MVACDDDHDHGHESGMISAATKAESRRRMGWHPWRSPRLLRSWRSRSSPSVHGEIEIIHGGGEAGDTKRMKRRHGARAKAEVILCRQRRESAAKSSPMTKNPRVRFVTSCMAEISYDGSSCCPLGGNQLWRKSYPLSQSRSNLVPTTTEAPTVPHGCLGSGEVASIKTPRIANHVK
jgi:hypothetical protein